MPSSRGSKPPKTDADLREELADKLMSMQAALHDIDRWLMQGIANGRLSADIAYHANRIAEQITYL